MAQTMRVIGRDLSCNIYDGGAVDGATGFDPEAPIAVGVLAREVRRSAEVGEIDTSALGDADKRFRPDQGEWTIELDLVVEVTGLIDIDLGNYVFVEHRAFSSWVSADEFTGFLKNLEVVSRMGEVCVQRMTLRGPADETPA